MNIGHAIKLCRTNKGLSQAALAERAECSVSYLSVLENNKRDPTLSTLTKISSALGVPLALLFFLGAEQGEIKGIEKELAGDLARATLSLMSKADAG